MSTIESQIAGSLFIMASYSTVEYVDTMSNEIQQKHEEYIMQQQHNINCAKKLFRGCHGNDN